MFSKLLSKYAPTQKALWEMNIFGTIMKKRCGSINLKQWEYQKNKTTGEEKLCSVTHSLRQIYFYSYFLFPISLWSSWKPMADGHMWQQTKWQADGHNVSPHTCVLQVEASSGNTDVRLEGQVQVVGRAVQQLWDCCTCIIQYTEDS